MRSKRCSGDFEYTLVDEKTMNVMRLFILLS